MTLNHNQLYSDSFWKGEEKYFITAVKLRNKNNTRIMMISKEYTWLFPMEISLNQERRKKLF